MPLSDTMVSGNPNLENSSCNTFIVVLVVGVLHLKTGYFVKLSTMTKSMFLLLDRHSQYVNETTVCLSSAMDWILWEVLLLPMRSFCSISLWFQCLYPPPASIRNSAWELSFYSFPGAQYGNLLKFSLLKLRVWPPVLYTSRCRCTLKIYYLF